MLRRPDFFCLRKRNRGKKTAIKGRAFYKDALPLIIPSSDVQNNSDRKKCQQCSVPINATHFSAHGANSGGQGLAALRDLCRH